MQRLKLVGFAFVALLAINAVASASASAAAPEFEGAFPTKLSGSSGNRIEETRIEAEGAEFLNCIQRTTSGEITSAKKASLTLQLTGCVFNPREQCHTAGSAEGTVVISAQGELVYIEKATKKVALALAIKETQIFCGETIFNFHARNYKTAEPARLILPITPVNTKTKAFTLTGSEKFGVQEPTWYENEAGKKVINQYMQMSWNGGGTLQVGVSLSSGLKFETASTIQIKA